MRIEKLLSALIVSCIIIAVPSVSRASAVKTGIVEANGAKLYYETQGEGPALVFIHGGGYDRRMWDDQVEVFAKQFKVIRYDVRGYGKSSMPTRPYSDVEDLHQLLNAIKVKKAHLIGLCMGSRIAIEFSIAHPETVETLMASSPSLIGFPFSQEVMQGIMMTTFSIQKDDGTPAGEVWLKDPFNGPAMENPEVARKLRPIAVENSRSWLVNPLFHVPLFPLAIQRLSEIRVPTLVIVGERDLPDIHKIGQMLETSVAGAKKATIAGAGHMVNVEKPQEFNKAVMDFLNARNQVKPEE
jgi:pimeloyl-ACP methyl ester carboxylesterase